MQPAKLVAVVALLAAAASTAAAQGSRPDICTNTNGVWTVSQATCDFICPDSSQWSLSCGYAGNGIECRVAAAAGNTGNVEFSCSMPPGSANPSCSGTFQGIDRNNNSCVMESIRVVLFSWQEGPAPAPSVEGAAPVAEGAARP